MFRWPTQSEVAFALVLLFPGLAYAELYVFTDEQGVVHFTNIPPKSAALAKQEQGYHWKDNLGVLRRVHRIDVTTYDAIIKEAATYYSLPPEFVKAVVAIESSFDPEARSPVGAQGLMQLMPQTAKEVFVEDPFDPKQNIYGGARYLRLMANTFEGDLRKTLAAYNAGPTAVKKADGVPNYPETRKYVSRVLHVYRHYLKRR